MVETGVARAFGANLRLVVGRSVANRWSALLAGLGVTLVLQSSTATALIAASFASRDLMSTAASFAVMLGANIGTALVAQILTLPLGWLPSLLLFGGVATFLASKSTLWRHIGRIGIGLGLMLLSLRLLAATSEPMRDALALHELLAALGGEPFIAILVATLITWAAHSSLAIVLLVAGLAQTGVVNSETAFLLVLGANIGGTIPAVIVSLHEGPAAMRVTLGNAAVRVIGAALIAPFIGALLPWITALGLASGRQVVDFHLFFNVATAILFIPLTEVAAALARRLLPDRVVQEDPFRPLYLDHSVIDSPSVALACAARETLHMGDIVERMLRESMTALLTDDRRLVGEIGRLDDAVDRLHEAIKLYVTEITRESLDEAEGRRAADIIAFTTNLEHIGDIIDKNLMELAAKKIKHMRRFSDDGAQELQAFHKRVLENLRLALGVFISGDVKIARQLIEEKAVVRDAERAAAENHFARLREGRIESIDSSSLHLDVLRDLKRIHSHICSVAYPVLEAAGELRPTGAKAEESEAPGEASARPVT